MLFFDLFRHDPNLVEFPAGQTLCQEGEVGTVMYVLLSGSAEVRSGSLLLEEVGVGDIVGELGVLDATPRIATVTALTDCTVAAVDQQRFHFLVEANPRFAIEVMQVMAKRLRQCDTRLRDQIAN
jgi:CRP/FNR family transcriptional regulator, cyclic AMP receptor protein